MTLVQVLSIIIFHGIADFLLQTKDMAMNKSKSNYWLSIHVFYYTLGMIPIALLMWFLLGLNGWYIGILWLLVNGVLHWIVDYNTSRWTKRLREEGKYYGFPSFFVAIEIDQIIHYICLFTTFDFFIHIIS